LQTALKRLVADFVTTYGDIALERLDGEEASFERIQESLQSPPFLAERKMVTLRTPGVNKQFTERIEDLLKALPDTTDVLVVEPKLDKRSSYYKFLKKATDYREFAELDEGGLVNWLREEAIAAGGQLSAADARFLVERIGANQQLLSNELQKLLLFDPHVAKDTITALTEPSPQSTIFELLEVAFAGDVKRSLELYRDQRDQRVEPAQIIAMLTWQLRVLAYIKASAGRPVDVVAREAKLNPFVLRKSQATAGRLSFGRLKRLVADLLLIDVRSKRENIDLDEALQLFLITISA
jgi:DNA polymerase-3 subunit delta